jgi:hypothetical protein
MTQITVSVQNETHDNQNVHVYDEFAGGKREVTGSPFALAVNEISPGFIVNADADGLGKVQYACDGGPSNSGLDVHDGDTLPIE